MVHILLAVIYLAFIGLGLPDSLLGSAWPSMYPLFGVPVSFAGIVSVLIAANTVISSLLSDRLTKRFGAFKVTAVSTLVSGLAMIGFSLCSSFWQLCLLAIPYGLGAGSIDAALNNFVALHYKSRHMSWLHCMWGVGTIVGPYVMGYALSGGLGWNYGYKSIGFAQLAIAAVVVLSAPLWKRKTEIHTEEKGDIKPKALKLGEIFRIKGAKALMISFFCYCALEQTAMLWASSYMVLHKGVPAEVAARYGGLFFIGITLGRAVNGFLTIKFTDEQMVRGGEIIIGVGILSMLLPLGNTAALIGLILVGVGCAPVYPCVIHSTPYRFGADKSQAIIGVQMASAYTGTCVAPPLFGLIANHINVALFPVYLLSILVVMAVMHEIMVKKTMK